MHEVNVTFGVKAHNADNLFIMYMYILLSWFNFGREPKIQEGEKKQVWQKMNLNPEKPPSKWGGLLDLKIIQINHLLL